MASASTVDFAARITSTANVAGMGIYPTATGLVTDAFGVVDNYRPARLSIVGGFRVFAPTILLVVCSEVVQLSLPTATDRGAQAAQAQANVAPAF